MKIKFCPVKWITDETFVAGGEALIEWQQLKSANYYDSH